MKTPDFLQRLIALLFLIVLSPLLTFIALAVRLRLGAPVFFLQNRPGLYGRPFQLIKFRTMTNACDEYGDYLLDEKRLTLFGKFLRRTSLDELPELINILMGDMVFVGPRPLLMQYLPLYSEEQARRHDVKPGLTGWAQVHGRNSLSWEEKFDLDVWYVDHCGILLDLRILWLTLRTVVRREGISSVGHVTMPPFTGSPSTLKFH
ncbi:sugar transferase [Synechococcus sp. AH-707-B22]|nr:sugar transferase [Synechococcus sp. AH-707-B22]